MKGNPPYWVTDKKAWERAKRIVRPHWSRYSQPWAVVAHVYRQITD